MLCMYCTYTCSYPITVYVAIFVGVIFSWKSSNNEIKTHKHLCATNIYFPILYTESRHLASRIASIHEKIFLVQLFYHLFEQQQHNYHEAFFHDKDSISECCLLYLLMDVI